MAEAESQGWQLVFRSDDPGAKSKEPSVTCVRIWMLVATYQMLAGRHQKLLMVVHHQK